MMRIKWNRASAACKLEELPHINLGEELVKYRCLTGHSADEVAEKLGVSGDYVRLIEWGLVYNVSAQTRQRIIELVLP